MKCSDKKCPYRDRDFGCQHVKCLVAGKRGTMNDSIGKMPVIKTSKQALKEILFIASDKRSHFLVEDAYDWLNLKMNLIKKIAKKAIKGSATKH